MYRQQKKYHVYSFLGIKTSLKFLVEILYFKPKSTPLEWDIINWKIYWSSSSCFLVRREQNAVERMQRCAIADCNCGFSEKWKKHFSREIYLFDAKLFFCHSLAIYLSSMANKDA